MEGAPSEFAYNLFTDLAPLLTLFGEPVAKQFLSHSTSWLECLIFACAPIGIITGITSAIRIGGKRWMKSIIGRAGEPEAAAELELMSSTSPDVCELWNGVGIVRVVGSPSILQIIYKSPPTSSSSIPGSKPAIQSDDDDIKPFVTADVGNFTADIELQPTGGVGLRHRWRTPEVYTLETACEADLFTLSSSSVKSKNSNKASSRPTSEVFIPHAPHTRRARLAHPSGIAPPSASTGYHYPRSGTTYYTPGQTLLTAAARSSSSRRLADDSPPNIFLNACSSSNNTLELVVIAFLGIFLQSAVLVYTWGITHHPKWKENFTSHEETGITRKYAFPATFVGTVSVVIGMFLCALVVNVSTVETTWVENTEIDGKVGLGAIRTSISRASRPRPSSVNGGGSGTGDGAEDGTQILWLQKGKLVGDQAFGSFAISPHTKKKIIRTSRKEDSIGKLSTWAFLGALLSILGFIFQLLGFRAMHGSASIAQLVATFVMTLLRVLIRRDISRKPLVEPVLEGYELDWMSLRICNCSQWGIITALDSVTDLPITEAVTSPYHSLGIEDPFVSSLEGRLALQVLQTRVRLSELSGWQGESWQVAEQLSGAIEAVLRCFYEGRAAEFTLKKEFTDIDSFEWTIPININSSPMSQDGRSQSGEGSSSTTSSTEAKVGLRLRLHRSYTGNQWTSWTVNRREIEASVSLWMYQMLAAKVPLVGNSLWLLTPYNTVNKITYSWWTQRGSKMNVVCVPAESIADTGVGDNPHPNPAGSSGVSPTPQNFLKFNTEVDENGDSQTIRVHRNRILNIVNASTSQSDSNNSPDDHESKHYLGIIVQHQTLQELCSQYLLSLFLNSAINTVSGLTGKTYVIPGTSDSSYTVGNDSIRCLASLVEENLQGYIGTSEDAYRLVVTPFIQAGHKLLDPSNDRPILQQILSLDRGGGNSVDLLEICTWKAEMLCGQDKLKEARKVYTSLIQLSSEVLATHHEFTDSVRVAMKGFIRKFMEARCSDEDRRSSTIQRIASKTEYYPLHKAAVQGNLALLHKFLEEGRSVDTPSIAHGQQTPLNYAIEYGHLDIIRLLILYGAYVGVDHVQQAGTISGSNAKAVGRLLALNCDPGISIHDAAGGGHTFVVQIFAEQGHPLDETNPDGLAALHLTVSSGYEEAADIVRILLEHGANVDVQSPEGTTPLQDVAADGSVEISKLLLKYGANINSRDREGRTPLHGAARNGRLEMVKLLAGHGADLSAYTYDEGAKTTALHLAVAEGHIEIVQYLAEKGARLDAQSADGGTPLHLAATWNRLDMAKALVELGAALNVQDELGVTPLTLYTQYDHATLEFVQVLLDHGADVRLTDDVGRSPLEYVSLKGNTAVVQLLLDHFGSSILSSTRDAFLRNALHYAAMEGHISTTELLLKYASDTIINAQDYNGWTPLHFAVLNCHTEMVDLLKQAGADETLKNSVGQVAAEYEGGYYRSPEGHMRRRKALPNDRTLGADAGPMPPIWGVDG